MYALEQIHDKSSSNLPGKLNVSPTKVDSITIQDASVVGKAVPVTESINDDNPTLVVESIGDCNSVAVAKKTKKRKIVRTENKENDRTVDATESSGNIKAVESQPSKISFTDC